MAICGGRDYVFLLDAGVVDRLSQLESFHGYLLEEADLGAEAGGKLRNAILTGFRSEYCMAAVKTMAIIADVWLWPMLAAIVPGDEFHILDVLPVVWPRCLAWLDEAAKDPQAAIDGTLSLRASFEAGKQRVAPLKDTASAKRKAERVQVDLERIRGALTADTEVRETLPRQPKRSAVRGSAPACAQLTPAFFTPPTPRPGPFGLLTLTPHSASVAGARVRDAHGSLHKHGREHAQSRRRVPPGRVVLLGQHHAGAAEGDGRHAHYVRDGRDNLRPHQAARRAGRRGTARASA